MMPSALMRSLIVVVFCPSTALAQFPDLLDVSAQYLPTTDFDFDSGRGGGVQVSSYDVSFNVPIPLGEKTYLIPGLAYHVESVSFDDLPEDYTQLRAFHAIDLNVLFVQLLPRDWSLSFRVSAGIAADRPAFEGGLFRFTGLALATHEFNDRLIVGGGGLVSYGFGSLLPLPGVYLEWKAHPKFAIETFLPAFVDLRYMPHERLEISAHVEFTGNSYGIRDSALRSAWPCAGQASDDPSTPMNETLSQRELCLDSIAYSTGSVGIDVAVRLVSSVWAHVYGAYAFYRRYEPKDPDGNTLDVDVRSLPATFLFRAGITWRIPGT